MKQVPQNQCYTVGFICGSGYILLMFFELYVSNHGDENTWICATGTRIRSTFDFGHVTLDISGLRESDCGIYTCRAVNRVGEAVSTCTLKVHGQFTNYLCPTSSREF